MDYAVILQFTFVKSRFYLKRLIFENTLSVNLKRGNMVCGRPQAPLLIIPENKIMDRNEVFREEKNITVLARAMPGTWESVKSSARHRLIRNSFRCSRCDVGYSFV